MKIPNYVRDTIMKNIFFNFLLLIAPNQQIDAKLIEYIRHTTILQFIYINMSQLIVLFEGVVLWSSV
jgi:hypothetical protein